MSLSPAQIKHLKSYASVLLSTFLSGVASYVVAALSAGVPETFTWKAGIVGAIAGGVIAVKHLFDTVPGDRPDAIIGELLSTADVAEPAKTAAKVAGPLAGLMLICALGVGTSGCAAFTSAVAKDPGVYVADFEMAAGVVNEGAKAIFPIVLGHLPAASQAAAQADFDKAETTYSDAMTAINAGLAGWRDGKASDWGKLLADGLTAVDAIIAIIDEYGGTVTPLAASQHAQTIGPAYVYHRQQLSSAVAVVHRYH